MILYLDCSSGISGDMLVSALLSLAGDAEGHTRTLDDVVRPALKAAGIDRRLVSVYDVRRGGVDALSFRVPEGPGFSTFDELIMAMYASSLDQRVADRVAALSQRMAAAEAEVHGAHLHLELDELGGLDTAVDLISAVTLIQHLAPERIVASPPELGGGTVLMAHGELNVPAPAVAVLLRGLPTAPLDPTGRAGELVTPTGEALLASAGHLPPVHLSDAGSCMLEPEYGRPLGSFESAYPARHFSLAHGDTLVLYTDGLTEARSDGELFGEERLIDVLCGDGPRDPQALVERARDAAMEFAGELKDDLQILAIRLI